MLTQAPQKLERVPLLHHRVQNYKVERKPQKAATRDRSAERVRGIEALSGQEVEEHRRYADIVIHNEDLVCGHDLRRYFFSAGNLVSIGLPGFARICNSAQ